MEWIIIITVVALAVVETKYGMLVLQLVNAKSSLRNCTASATKTIL